MNLIWRKESLFSVQFDASAEYNPWFLRSRSVCSHAHILPDRANIIVGWVGDGARRWERGLLDIEIEIGLDAVAAVVSTTTCWRSDAFSSYGLNGEIDILPWLAVWFVRWERLFNFVIEFLFISKERCILVLTRRVRNLWVTDYEYQIERSCLRRSYTHRPFRP